QHETHHHLPRPNPLIHSRPRAAGQSPQEHRRQCRRIPALAEGQFLTAAEAMPEAKYSFSPSAGEFKGVRSFAEQVKHVACANFAFFNEIEGKTPPPGCEKGGPAPARTKAELVKYLQDSFDYGHRVLAIINEKDALARVEGPYAGPNTRLGIAVAAVW